MVAVAIFTHYGPSDRALRCTDSGTHLSKYHQYGRLARENHGTECFRALELDISSRLFRPKQGARSVGEVSPLCISSKAQTETVCLHLRELSSA
jgi:hypothetical protein